VSLSLLDEIAYYSTMSAHKDPAMLTFTLSRDSDLPLYRQIAEQIRHQIRDAQLPVGTRLPSIRALARQLEVTRLTIEAAYDELQAHGWIETIVGSGTFVAQTAHPHDQIKAVGLEPTPQGVLNDMARIGEIEVVQSFAYAEPDETLFPLDAFWNIMNTLKAQGTALMSYGPQEGQTELRVQLSALLRERGIETIPGDILVTTGVTQGLSLVVQALTNPGDFVAVEQPTHIMFLHALKAHRVTPIGVPVDESGPQLAMLEKIIIQQRPRFFYTIPSFHNPTGIFMTDDRRRQLLALAQKYGMIVVEDDIYGFLAYDHPPLPALKAQDDTDLVIHLGGFSKALMPGLRLGYMTAPQPLHRRLLSFKHAADLCTPGLTQLATATFLRSGHFRAHLKRVVPVYARRRDRLIAALNHTMPPEVSWLRPEGGFNCWLTLPPGVDAVTIQRLALKQRIAVTPGSAFWFDPVPANQHIRICFVRQPEHVIDEGIATLARIIGDEIASL
jgi:DNA-binding transcriptional MocR family regulator